MAAIKFYKFSRKLCDGMGNNSGKINFNKKNVIGQGISFVYSGTFFCLQNLFSVLILACVVQFRESIRRNLPQISGRCVNRFHPTDAVLACGSQGQVTIFKSAKCSVPFSDWRIELELKVQNEKEITFVSSLEWNVSYSNFTEFLLGYLFRTFKWCLNIKSRVMCTTNKVALFHFIIFMCRWTGHNWLLGATMAPSSLGLIHQAKSSLKWMNIRSGWLKSNGIHSAKTCLLLVKG